MGSAAIHRKAVNHPPWLHRPLETLGLLLSNKYSSSYPEEHHALV